MGGVVRAQIFVDEFTLPKQQTMPYHTVRLSLQVASDSIKSSEALLQQFLDSSGSRFSASGANTRYSTKQSDAICFVTASYALNETVMDPLPDMTSYKPPFKFFLFTNLKESQWSTPGWEKVVTDFTFRRRITHSRYGKFLSWKYPRISNLCRSIFYIDSTIEPTKNLSLWEEATRQMEAVDGPGFMQYPHPKNRSGLPAEFRAIRRSRKDTYINVNKSWTCMEQDPSWKPKMRIFLNTCLGYNPKSKTFQRVSQTFWERYSLELDSWRDQPLWSFNLNRQKVIPLNFPDKFHTIFKQANMSVYGHNGHTYRRDTEVNIQF